MAKTPTPPKKHPLDLIKQRPLVTLAASLLIWNAFHDSDAKNKNVVPFSQFSVAAHEDKVKDIEIRGAEVTGHLRDGTEFRTTLPTYGDAANATVIQELLSHNVEVAVKQPSNRFLGIPIALWTSLLPIALLLWGFSSINKVMANGIGGSKSPVRKYAKGEDPVTFDDVAGVDEAKQDLAEIVEYLKDPKKFGRLGGKIPKGVLLMGPPGTGKTLLARAVAGEAGVPFFSASGSEFVEMFVGRGAARVRAMFEEAKKDTPCIIFIDEIDALGGNRDNMRGNDEKQQTLNQMLTEMDGFGGDSGIIIIGATNRAETLDPAFLRPGRFDRRVVVPLPDQAGREQILHVHTDNKPLAADVRISDLARGTPGFSGAELANLANEAALLAARLGKKVITAADFEEAKDKILMGAERNIAMTDDERRLTAWHEAGHAIVGLFTPESDPLHKVSIMPRGRALGVTVSLPEGDQLSTSQQKLKSRLAMLFGGREAEKMVFGEQMVTTGASSDIAMATTIATAMVCEYGMSELGSARISASDAAMAPQVNEQVRKLIAEAERTARTILIENKDKLDRLAKALLADVDGTLEGAQVLKLLGMPARSSPTPVRRALRRDTNRRHDGMNGQS